MVQDHPQLQAGGRWAQVDSPAGPVPALLPPGMTREEARMEGIPALGEHTAARLAELGLSPGDIDRLRAAGAV